MPGHQKKLAVAIAVSALALTGCGGEAQESSQEFPSKPITLVIPYEPGGGTDIMFRAAIPFLEEELGQPVVPKNVPGASATNGSREVRDAQPDGYTILGSHETVIQTNIAGVSDYSYDAFEPVALMAETPIIAAVNADRGWGSAEEFKSAVEENPGGVPWGVTTGSTSHFFAQMMLEEMGLPSDSLNIVNYVGTTDAMTAIQTGEIAGSYADIASSKSQFDSGAFSAIGVASDERLDELPEAETFPEQGFDFNYSTARGFFAPKDTPEETVQKLSKAVEAVVANEDFQERIRELGALPSYMSYEDYEQYLADLDERFRALAEDMEF